MTYRTTRLLIDPASSSLANIVATTRTVCHELAHMWFGNLCTMQVCLYVCVCVWGGGLCVCVCVCVCV